MTEDEHGDHVPPTTYYVLVCRECEPILPMPFTSPEERGRWAAEHTQGTGHDRWIVRDETR